MKIEINDILTFQNNKKFLVLSSTIYNNIKYYYLVEVNENGDEIVDNIKIVKELENAEGLKLINVIDLDEIELVKEALVENLD